MLKKCLDFFLLLTLCSLSCSKSTHAQSTYFSITYKQDSLSEKWANYLFQHLERRRNPKEVLQKQTKANTLGIHITIDKTNTHDYCIDTQHGKLYLTAKKEETMLWLIYQLIGNLAASNSTILAEDIPPAIISMHAKCVDFDFAYREPYFSLNLELEQAPILGNNMLETDWGLWGHTMHKVLTPNLDNSIYASDNGKTYKDQFCFSSEDLFAATKSYITDNFGDGSENSYRFMIMPNDNPKVCMCSKCEKKGNSQNDATPALSDFILKLAKYFPEHIFFTTAYSSVNSAPKTKWPENTGVLLSSIALPKGVALMPSVAFDTFSSLLEAWQQKTSRIYIWDYAANFDDWWTPLPVLYALQTQLKQYKELGVQGVFLNANGYEYTAFDDVKTYVSGALMMDVNASINKLCEQYFTQYYPVSSKSMLEYYLFLEHSAQQTNTAYELYGNFKNSLVFAYPERFVAFYDALEGHILVAETEEKRKLVKLQIALSYTRIRLALELGTDAYGFAKQEGNKMLPLKEIRGYLERLKEHSQFDDMQNYKETEGQLDSFIQVIEESFSNPIQNLLLGATFDILPQLDEEYPNIQVLQDGLSGNPNDYHNGWLLYSAEAFNLGFQITQHQQKATELHFRFLNSETHNIKPPWKIVLYKNARVYMELYPEMQTAVNVVELSVAISLSEKDVMIIELIKNKETKSIGIDEIILH